MEIHGPRNSCAVTKKMNEREIRVEDAVERIGWNPVSRKQTVPHQHSCNKQLALGTAYSVQIEKVEVLQKT
jgi:hypothetical protein